MTNKFGFSKIRSIVGVGAASVIVLAGVTLIGVGAASAATLGFTSAPTSGTAGVAFGSFTVTETGGTVTDSILLSSNCGSVSGVTGIILDTAGAACTLTATDQTSGGTPQATSAFVESPAAVSKLAFTTEPPTTSPANTALSTFRVSSEDQFGNVATSNADTTDAILIGSSCTPGGTLTGSEIAGVVAFSAVTLNQVGSCILSASDSTNSLITAAASSAVLVSGGTPAKLAFTTVPPASVLTTGTVITTFKVSVEDGNGNVDATGAGSSDVIDVSSPCFASPSTPYVATATAGVATFSSAEFASTGTCVLTASDPARATVAAATATSIVGQAQAALTVTSHSGYLDAPLTLAATGGSGTGAVTFSVTNGTATNCAIASGTLTAKTGGTCIVTAIKAAVAPYASVTSVATTVTISSAPKAVRLVGAVWNARKTTVTVTGYNFSGRPKIASNVVGFTATVSRDSGKSLTIVVTVKGSASKPGVKVLTIKFANGKTTSVRYSLH
jgi:trimeric autotransporter adhesin